MKAKIKKGMSAALVDAAEMMQKNNSKKLIDTETLIEAFDREREQLRKYFDGKKTIWDKSDETTKGEGEKVSPKAFIKTFAVPLADISKEDPYYSLAMVFEKALEQAIAGKGKERHASDGQRFEDQLICDINRRLGSIDGQLFQGIKKAYESKRLLRIKGNEAAKHELLGAMVYLASCVILIDEGVGTNGQEEN